MNEPNKCPNCDAPWNEDISIYETFLYQGNDEAEAEYLAECYGATKENKKAFKRNIVGVEIPGRYDGVSYWKCTNCYATYDREFLPIKM